MFASVFVVIGVAAADVGGIAEIWRIAYDHGRVEFFKYVVDRGNRSGSTAEEARFRVITPYKST